MALLSQMIITHTHTHTHIQHTHTHTHTHTEVTPRTVLVQLAVRSIGSTRGRQALMDSLPVQVGKCGYVCVCVCVRRCVCVGVCVWECV